MISVLFFHTFDTFIHRDQKKLTKANQKRSYVYIKTHAKCFEDINDNVIINPSKKANETCLMNKFFAGYLQEKRARS